MPFEMSCIAVTQRVVQSPHGEQRDCLDQEWTVWLESQGFRCIPVPNRSTSPAGFVEALQPAGIVLSGGNNLARDVYDVPGLTRPPDAYDCRDSTEHALVELAIRRHIPLLGCCRGMQFLHVYFGGRLASVDDRAVHVGRNHTVNLVDERFRELAGETSLSVNSFHSFSIRSGSMADPLIPFALSADDSSIEGCFHRTLPLAGIMWHPERRNPGAAFDRRLAASLFGRAIPNKSGLEPLQHSTPS